MVKAATVPLSLLEDIFRLLEYLDSRGDGDGMHFHCSGYSHGFERDNALWELGLKIRRLRGRIAETYLLTVDGVTENERHDLREWTDAGNSVYDNPYSLHDESGRPVDFINGCRLGTEMAEDPSPFSGTGTGHVDDGDRDDGLPF